MKAFLSNQKMSFLLRSICFLFLVSSFLNNTFVSSTQHLCHSDQRDALLEFKDEFSIYSDDSFDPKTKSWVNKSDCCSWDGITCDAKSGKVIGLDLSSSFLHGQLESNSSLFRLRHLRDLNLAYNDFNNSPIPDSISSLKHLTSLTLSNSYFSGKIPFSLGNLSHLSYLHLYSNNFVGEIPSSIGNLKQLIEFDVSENKLSGNLPASILNFTQLRSLFLFSNHFTGSLPPIISQISKLETFAAFDNSFTGAILPSLVKIPSLTRISLSYNQFSDFTGIGNISLLPNLLYLHIHNKNYNKVGLVDLNVFSPLKKLYFLYLLGIPLSTANITSDSDFPSHLHLRGCNITEFPEFKRYGRKLETIDLSNNKIKGQVPPSICGQSSLEVLDLSENNLHGSIPRCLETLMIYFSHLNLSNNNLSGSLPDIFMNAKKLWSLDVSHNRMEGKLPVSLTGCSALEVLNVGNNKINDMFPFQLNSLQKLQVLVLRSNKFHGTLHNADGVWVGFPQLKIIDVSYNEFVGTLPSDYFLNWTVMSSKRDNSMEPAYISNIDSGYYASLVLMSKGISMEMERILTIYTAVDFSGNQLFGQIPDSVGLLKELHNLNLSSNAFTGHIPSSLANLTNLESLDLSQNKISGEIPPELGTLYSLEWINVSHNQLEGSIPQGTQFQRQNCSSYEGNTRLNGLSLKDICRDIKAPTPSQPEPLEIKEEEEEESVSWVAAGLGFAPGVVFGLAMGYIVAS